MEFEPPLSKFQSCSRSFSMQFELLGQLLQGSPHSPIVPAGLEYVRVTIYPEPPRSSKTELAALFWAASSVLKLLGSFKTKLAALF